MGTSTGAHIGKSDYDVGVSMNLLIPLGLGAVAIAVMAIFTMLAARRRHAASHAAPATQVGPSVLVHDINDDRCTGCDACVAVCPTNVLELVDNKSRVLRFEDCIQCEACMFACPTEALVMFPEGTPPPPLKLPEMDEFFQTATKGQYLIGEVAGKPLVKNAANLGRMAVEHMRASGLRPGRTGDPANVDVAIVGSGPAGLSAALTCIQRGLTYVVLDKEQLISSTIARYPKGKLVMAEPYDTQNLSLLPVFDSSKELLLPIWNELLERAGVQVKLGESVESVTGSAGAFKIKTTVASYQAQRVVLAIGTRGKPRTLQVPGENLPKIASLLEDPDAWRGKSVLVVGGGDSAVEAALALADAGAKVIVSYRGNAFSRCAPKNRQAVERYAAEGRLKAKLQSTVVSFSADAMVLQFADGSQKQYANHGAFVLIGADPPVAWLEKMGVRFVEREHQYQLGRSDELLQRVVPGALPCPETAAEAAAVLLGHDLPAAAVIGPAVGAPARTEHSVARKWLRAATNMLTGTGKRGETRPGDGAGRPISSPGGSGSTGVHRVPRQPSLADAGASGSMSRAPSHGFGRQATNSGIPRDQLSAGERTRVLRMLRDEGGRIADEESQMFKLAPPVQGRFDLPSNGDDSPIPELRAQAAMASVSSPARPDAKQAVVEGLAEAQARSRRGRPGSAPGPARGAPPPSRRPPMHAFREEETRQVDADMLKELRQVRGEPANATPPAGTGFDENEATVMTDPDDLRQRLPARRAAAAAAAAAPVAPAGDSMADVDWDLD